MSAFADHLDLRTAVVEQVGSADIAEVFPRLLALAETKLNRQLRLRDQITDTPVTVTEGKIWIPPDWLETIGLYDANGCEFIMQSPQRTAGGGSYYSVGQRDIVTGATGVASMAYYASIPTLAGSISATNWLLQSHPHIYLYAAGFEAAKWMRDRELASDMAGLLTDELNEVRADDERARYSRARVRVKGPTP